MPDLRKEIMQLINRLQTEQGVVGEVSMQAGILTVTFANGEVWDFTQPLCISHCARCGERFASLVGTTDFVGVAEVADGLIHDACLREGEEVA